MSVVEFQLVVLVMNSPVNLTVDVSLHRDVVMESLNVLTGLMSWVVVSYFYIKLWEMNIASREITLTLKYWPLFSLWATLKGKN